MTAAAPDPTGEQQLVDAARVAKVALDEVRMWRHRQPHHDAPRYAELDAILDRAAVGRIEVHLAQPEPRSLPEAVAAHHALIDQRRRIIADAHRAWDLVEVRVIRSIARFMPADGRKDEAA
ncbi:hypothetical protein [Streptomyces boncukensis]|uniref:Uncharacterized protein n=1 Tax=Streptomyces boncukensis TaxID=2711219 RepID=A0A6G4WU07_9ACTN|nr:hypothetical protein [Streptomyces boncukensis]NGO68024.1 hypothetical protein [Streptomyces boncukensis]